MGDCYEAAARLLLSLTEDPERGFRPDSTWRLVHGTVAGRGTLKGRRFGHAWLEDGEVVLDPSNGNLKMLPRDAYHTIGQVEDAREYTATEMRIKLVKHEHWGPWEEDR